MAEIVVVKPGRSIGDLAGETLVVGCGAGLGMGLPERALLAVPDDGAGLVKVSSHNRFSDNR